MPTLVLASSSPRRREILARLGLEVTVIAPDADEARRPGETPADFVRRAAREKALAVARGLGAAPPGGGVWVIAADTEVVIGDETLGKPRDVRHAEAMLRDLSGREHLVMTGWVVLDAASEVERSGVEVTRVWFKALRPAEVEAYARSGEGLDKAGAYGIQGLGCFLVEHIEGNYENVVGLPACALVEALEDIGAIPVFPLPVVA
jgi:septum formation protein